MIRYNKNKWMITTNKDKLFINSSNNKIVITYKELRYKKKYNKENIITK